MEVGILYTSHTVPLCCGLSERVFFQSRCCEVRTTSSLVVRLKDASITRKQQTRYKYHVVCVMLHAAVASQTDR